MMNFNNNGKTYSIRFFYDNVENQEDVNPLEATIHKRIKTTCKITEKIEKGKYNILSSGESVNHSNDLFTKDTGRKLAMAKALHRLIQDRKIRREFWLEYFNHHKEGKKLIQAGKI